MNKLGKNPCRVRQQGAAAIMMATGLVVFALGASAVAYLRQAQWSVDDQVAQRSLALEAKEQVLSFAERQGRLPCPAKVPAGAEDCSVVGKGYLPVKSLWSESAQGGPASIFRQTRYGAYRGSGADMDPDLTSLSDAYRPEGGIEALPASYGTIMNSWDFCFALAGDGQAQLQFWERRWARASGAASRDGRTAFTPIDGRFGSVALRNMAFALAMPAEGAASDTSGINVNDTPLFEDPDRGNNEAYRDVVEVASFDEVYSRSHCGVGLMTVDHVEHARFGIVQGKRAIDGFRATSDKYIPLDLFFSAAALTNVASAVAEPLSEFTLFVIDSLNPATEAAPLFTANGVQKGIAAGGALAQAIKTGAFIGIFRGALEDFEKFKPWSEVQTDAPPENQWIQNVDSAGATRADI